MYEIALNSRSLTAGDKAVIIRGAVALCGDCREKSRKMSFEIHTYIYMKSQLRDRYDYYIQNCLLCFIIVLVE